MVEMQSSTTTTEPPIMASSNKAPPPLIAPPASSTAISPATAVPSAPAVNTQTSAARLRSQLVINPHTSPVNQNGSFEFDRVIKSGYVQKRTQKTKAWRTIFLVLRPNALSIYKSDKEDKLRHKIFLSDLTAVALLKDPKQKRQHVFGLFSPSRNYHFQAKSAQDAFEWVDRIRAEARIEEEEEEMFLSSPAVRRQSYHIGSFFTNGRNRQAPTPATAAANAAHERERLASSSPELPQAVPPRRLSSQQQLQQQQQQYSLAESSGWSGNELASSDYSDGGHASDVQNRMRGLSFESLAGQSPPFSTSPSRPSATLSNAKRSSISANGTGNVSGRNSVGTGGRNISQASVSAMIDDPDRVVWQGWLYLLRSKGGMRQWKNSWAVLRPRNLILYKDESEYAAQLVVPLSSIVNVVERDPISRTKAHCLQVITEEKIYRFSAHDEESLLLCLGAFKSLLTKRRDLEIRAAAVSSSAPGATQTVTATITPALTTTAATPTTPAHTNTTTTTSAPTSSAAPVLQLATGAAAIPHLPPPNATTAGLGTPTTPAPRTIMT